MIGATDSGLLPEPDEPTQSAVFDAILEAQRPVPTGKFLVTFQDGTPRDEQREALKRATEGQVEVSGILDDSDRSEMAKGHSMLFEDIGIAVLSPGDDTRASAMMHSLGARTDVLEARPAYYLFAVEQAPYTDTAARTWGIEAVGASTSPWTGLGIRIAVLDTGYDDTHPDFLGRTVVAANFTRTGSVRDVQGHGTHCAGTAAGPRRRVDIPRYGIAPDADLYIGKVLDDTGRGEEDDILAGLRWAIAEGCEVISMSLGRTVRRGEPPSPLYDRLGRFALERGCLVIAAAGNDSARASGFIAPVSEPANSPTFLAVAAIDQRLQVAYFSNGGINGAGGAIDLAGPGVNVFSSAPEPRLYRTMGGTSMACPHVAGTAALWAQSDPALRGERLWRALSANAVPLGLPARDVGAGLVRVPQDATLV
jgi:subtilisin family serine protease